MKTFEKNDKLFIMRKFLSINQILSDLFVLTIPKVEQSSPFGKILATAAVYYG